MASFKEATGLANKKTEKEKNTELHVNNAASALLAAHDTKTARITARVSESTLSQFTFINKRRGATNSSILNTLVTNYIKENKDLLE